LPVAAVSVLLLSLAANPPAAAAAGAAGAAAPSKPSCANTSRLLCAEVDDYEAPFKDKYVGHDEPSLLFYSNRPGSGNAMRYDLTLPKDPPPVPIPGRAYNFMLHPAFWFGMALCDTQSYPQQVSTCTPDSDTNITSSLTRHPGTAFMELQFYPPGFVKQFNGSSCDATQWCAAMTIDSLSEDPVAGTVINPTCQNQILGGVEYVNFAYITMSGKPQGSPNPLQFDPVASGEPNPAKALFMHQNDHIQVTLHDTAHGLHVDLNDLSTHRSGSMTASAANGFGQIAAAPTGTACSVLPYDFHPMYSTSSPATRVPWAAHSYNVAFSDEIGHFDSCTKVDPATGSCTGLEGVPGDQEPADGDDNGCFTPAQSTLVPVTGCLDTNAPGFDGASYRKVWPDGNTRLHPTPVMFTSPRTGRDYETNYTQAAFETDTPRIDAPDVGGVCDRVTGTGCTLVPPTDDGVPADFYPFYSSTARASSGGDVAAANAHGDRSNCQWLLGNNVPGLTRDNFGGVSQYGALYPLSYLIFGGGGATRVVFNDYHATLPSNPCRS
jgi:hypothetical protein